MPYGVFKGGNPEKPHCVYKRGPDGRSVGASLGCHATPRKAAAQIAAIQISERMEPGKAGKLVGGFKALPGGRWVGFFSNIFYDRDIKPDAPRGERFTYDALKDAAKWMNEGNMPHLQIFHLDGFKVGRADTAYVVGPFIVAEGVWNNDTKGQQARVFFENSRENWRMSHGFGYFSKDRKNGEYHQFRPHEVTILTEKWAANPVTLFTEDDMSGIKQDIEQMLQDVFRIKPEEAKALVEEQLSEAGKSLLDGSVAGRKDAETQPAADAPVAEAEAETLDTQAAAPTPEPEKKEPPEEQSESALAVALADALTELAAERSLRTEMEKRVKGLEEKYGELQTGSKAIQDGLEARLKTLEAAEQERMELLPKALKAALSKRASGDSLVDDKEVHADVEQREAGLKNEPSNSNDPIGWMMKKAGAA